MSTPNTGLTATLDDPDVPGSTFSAYIHYVTFNVDVMNQVLFLQVGVWRSQAAYEAGISPIRTTSVKASINPGPGDLDYATFLGQDLAMSLIGEINSTIAGLPAFTGAIPATG